MSIARALAMRCELVYKLKRVAPHDRPEIIRLNKKIASIDAYLKSMPPMMAPTVRP
jgi:hypothetical protein